MGDQAVLAIALGLAVVAGGDGSRACAAQPASSVAQSPSPSAQPAAPHDVEQARRALAAGHLDEAIALSERALARSPRDRAATELQIRAFTAKGELDKAWATYDRYTKQVGTDEAQLLGQLALATLRAVAKDPHSIEGTAALEVLAQDGDTASRDALKRLAFPPAPAQPAARAVTALARLGDPRAVDWVVTKLGGTDHGLRITALQLLAETAPARLRGALAGPLADPNPLVKAAAIDAAAAAGARDHVPAIKRAMSERNYALRLHGAAALHRLGDTTEAAILDAALASPLPDARLLAAPAFVGSPDTRWIQALVPVLGSENPLMAVRAAALLVESPQRAAAVDLLWTALKDPNPVVREEAAAAVVRLSPPPLPTIRLLMRDASPAIRIRASKAVLPGSGERSSL